MYKTYLTKSKEPSIRIKRAVKQLKDTNDIIGNTIFEQIIAAGVEVTEDQLEFETKTKRIIELDEQLYEIEDTIKKLSLKTIICF